MIRMNDHLARRFIRDFGLPIPIESAKLLDYYVELYDKVYDTKRKYKIFKECLKDFNTEEQFFEYRNGIVHDIVEHFENHPSYRIFNESKDKYNELFNIPKENITKNLYSPLNADKYYVSIDLREANFTVLKNLDKSMVFNADSYEEFIKNFNPLSNEYFGITKHMRQSILGKLNSKKIVKRAKYLLDNYIILPIVDKQRVLDINQIRNFNHDEYVFEVTLDFKPDSIKIPDYWKSDVKVSMFYLKQIEPYNFFVKMYFKSDSERKYDFKGVNVNLFPQVYKHYFGLEIEDKDLMFTSDSGLKAKYIEALKWS